MQCHLHIFYIAKLPHLKFSPKASDIIFFVGFIWFLNRKITSEKCNCELELDKIIE